MFIEFPVINLSGLFFIGSIALTLVDHFMWFYYFTRKSHSMLEIASFFTFIVWIVPFQFFISLSANENSLPSIGILLVQYI